MPSEERVLHNRYKLLSQLGAGGMGSVWLARDMLLERQVALKELLEYLPDPEERRQRALREARAMARVKHSAIVRIYDVFESGSDPCIVMEYIRGRSLADIIRGGALTEREIARIGLPVLNGLSAAHAKGVVHRDVKPDNILVADDEDDAIFLVDFGIAKIVGDIAITKYRRTLGTVEFIAPERLDDPQETIAASDLWSLGVTFFYALEGYSPFRRSSPDATVAAILRDPPPGLKATGRLADMVIRMLAKEPAGRPGAAEVTKLLTSILGPVAMPEPPTRLVPVRPPDTRSPHRDGNGRVDLRLDDARALIKDATPGEAAAMLVSMPRAQSAQILADCSPGTAGEIVKAMAGTHPRAVGAILRTLPPSRAGRVVNHLSASSAVPIIAAMPASDAMRILTNTDARMAGGVMTALPRSFTAEILGQMQDAQALAVLPYVEPVTVAALLGSSEVLNQRLLSRLSPPVRDQVRRHLRGR